jgi:hypothetical protein
MVYMGSLNPINDVFWLLLHHHPLAEQDHSFAAIISTQKVRVSE